ncbi:MAG: hypothetical protein H0X33_02490 [Taibaiella sp.]|nr:hypothetical protein [Taibaiella sp.]
MNFTNNKGIAIVLASIGMLCSVKVSALPNVTRAGHAGLLRTTAAACQPATATLDLDINNVRARLMTGGDMWWNQGTSKAAYEVPKGGGASSLFAGSIWIGGSDNTGQLKVAAQTYRQDGNDYWPGALDAGLSSIGSCSKWDRFWKINKSDLIRFRSLQKSGSALDGSQFQDIYGWPATGNQNILGADGNPLNTLDPNRSYAPFVDADNNGLYDPTKGDYPAIDGDQYIWWVFNDAGNIKGQTQTASIGLEVQASAFAYSTNDALNNATFYNYRIINRGSFSLDSTYIATWSDADLGYAFDDYIGCDTSRGLGILYNGTSFDGQGGPGTYGANVPMVGVDFFKGPKKKIPDYQHPGQMKDTTLGMTVFDYYNNDFTDIGNPSNGIEIYNYMSGSLRKGERFSNDWSGAAGSVSRGYGKGPISKFVFYGDPEPASNTWSECVCGNIPGDRRFIHSSGPVTLAAGDVEDITIGAVWVSGVGGCPNTSFKQLRAADDAAQALFDANFKAIEGPEAPRLVFRELDRKVVFYLENDPQSNNFREQYGYSDSLKYHQPALKAKQQHNPDSLYKFEGYRVFQLANSSVSVADIFNSTTGELDATKAAEVFECDIQNGVTTIINYAKRSDVSDSTYVPQVKVKGRDSGIVHSFVIDQDQFATGNDKQLVNYRNYYYVAIAYAYNGFSPFSARHIDSSQDIPYLSSSHGEGGIPITVDTVMPNPVNGTLGTTLNTAFDSGVVITRIMGEGNGGNNLELTDSSINNALVSHGALGYIDAYATYRPGRGPINIKVIDPIKVVPADWELYIKAGAHNSTTALYANTAKGILPDSATWMLIAHPSNGALPNPDTIYSEHSLSIVNEQILEKYGISVSLKQVTRPGDDETNGNGYITSNISFADTTNPWLAGVHDQPGVTPLNWLRTGNGTPGDTSLNCNYYPTQKFDTLLAYQNLLANSTFTQSSWGPYSLGAILDAHGKINGQPVTAANASPCGFAVSIPNTEVGIDSLFSVDVVFTSDKSKWSRCAVLEQQEDPALAEGNAAKFALRAHASWTQNVDAYGSPIYDNSSSGMSWFPGYAINVETGERVNIVFGEDSWLKNENGGDMIWNPTSNILNTTTGDVIFGGKHYIYIANTRYDGDSAFVSVIKGTNAFLKLLNYETFQWVGVPLLSSRSSYLPLSQGQIPNQATVRIRVKRPYAFYNPQNTNYKTGNNANRPTGQPDSLNNGFPYYRFSTRSLIATPVSDATDKNPLLDKINVVPNPYYGYAGYENNRLDTRVRIINLPARTTVYIYALDGTLIRTLTKVDPNTAYIDWDLRNNVGLQVASGMYLMDVKADGIGEKVLRWFGALRPIDITSF